jgi:hypothetical protein
MPVFCIAWRQPGTRVRAAVIVIIYVLCCRLAPDAEIPLAIGGLAGGWLAAAPARRPAYLAAGSSSAR